MAATDREAARARRSKIGRLPWSIRNELCERLLDGASGAEALRWLNAQPELGKAGIGTVSAQNLSAWRRTGYAAWLREREKARQVREYAETASHIAAEPAIARTAEANGHAAPGRSGEPAGAHTFGETTQR